MKTIDNMTQPPLHPDSSSGADSFRTSNRHIHSYLSPCADRSMTIPNIVEGSEELGMKSIAIVDHHPIPNQNILKNIDTHRRELADLKTSLNISLGAELSAYDVGKYADSLEVNRQIPYRLYSCNHYHQSFWKHPAKRTPRGYASHMLAILRELIPTGRADCIAHPFIGFYIPHLLPYSSEVTKSITDDELAEIMELGKRFKVAWEINANTIFYDFTFARRYWKIGTEIGVEFRFGTDAHQLRNLMNDAPYLLFNREIPS
ncbi:MAG: hypothetical protein WC703_01925 [Candidatus Neomarinimicrobiota bacterium]